MDAGKRFEGRFSKSLHALPGASMRIEDGGGVSKNQQWGDFLFWADDGMDWLIECKATSEASFPMRNIRKEQLAKLKTYESLNNRHGSVIAINFYTEHLATNECILIRYQAFEDCMKRCLQAGRKSIPRLMLVECGHLQEQDRGIWTLDFKGVEQDDRVRAISNSR